MASVEARAARGRGHLTRTAYRALLRALARRPLRVPRDLPCRVYAFSSRSDLPEQVVSMRSFLAHAGRPSTFVVVSDGTHEEDDRELLRTVDPCVEVADLAQAVRADLPPAVRRYAAADANGRKLALELSLPRDGAVVYADADVLFFPGARVLASLVAEGGPPRFLLDCEPYVDRRLVSQAEAALPPVNGGFLVLFGGLAWDAALDRLDRLGHVEAPVFHTEQTLLHLAMHASGGRPLDRGRYVVATDDMGSWRDGHAHRELILRHYTTPVRHKLWNALSGARVRDGARVL